MSDNHFTGRKVSEGHEALNFDLCEICQRKFPNWVETRVEGRSIEIRVTCNNCHELNFKDQDDFDPNVTRSLENNEEIPEVTRPAWVEEFLSEQNESGTIETINTSNITETSEFEEQIAPTSTNDEDLPVAPWSADFIREALFGINVREWLISKGALSSNQLKKTISTLNAMNSSQVANVKLFAIEGLGIVCEEDTKLKAEIINILNIFKTDIDEIVAQAAENMILKIKD